MSERAGTPLIDPAVDDIVARALAEDAPWGDITSESFVPAEALTAAVLDAREPGVFSGVAIVESVFRQVDPAIRVTLEVADGQRFVAGEVLGRLEGSARGILRGERIALNLIQRMSGIATLTARYMDEVAGTHARVTDTRKTTPGLRALERAAVRHGGGRNHRYSLSDAVLAKDNHLAVLRAEGLSLTDAIRSVKERLGHTTHLEVEVDRVDQIEPVLAGGVDTIMLDNFSLAELREGVALVAGRALVEASGGVNLDTIRGIAETGVDLISVGALTHSVRALDIGLDMEPPRRTATGG